MFKGVWKAVPKEIWHGRDDSKESPIAKRLFQTITIAEDFDPKSYPHKTAILGFKCDEGVKINKGRPGAAKAPDEIRKSLANLASYDNHTNIVDMGNIDFAPPLDFSQNILADAVKQCQHSRMKTLVLGGGHETAYGHGLGIYKAYPSLRIGIINFDAHLDVRTAESGSSGTPFKQLYEYCCDNNRPFEYMCVGASKAANTQALIKTAKEMDVKIIWDIDCTASNISAVTQQIDSFINSVDIIYLTIDLDVLPFSTMYAASAPAALGVDLRTLILMSGVIVASGKLKGVDFVEYVPDYDPDKLCVRAIARLIWQICLEW